MNKFGIAILSIFLSFEVMGAVSQKEIKALKKKLVSQSNDIYKIGATIQSLEEELGQKNNSYLEQVSKTTKLEEKLNELKRSLALQEEKIKESKQKLKKLSEKLILEKVDDSSDDSLLKQKLYISALLESKNELNRWLEETKTNQNNVKLYYERLQEYKKTENEIYELVVDLENKKKELSENYLQKVADKNTLESKLDSAVASFKVERKKNTRVYRNVELDLGLPLQSFVGYKISKKGVNFKYKDVAPINATENGEVVYSGDLATYGKVIIVDHGKEIRSVFLGDIATKVYKGDKVKKGDIIGYTNTNRGIEKNLYYELRKKNIAQNTYEWLEKNNSQKLKI